MNRGHHGLQMGGDYWSLQTRGKPQIYEVSVSSGQLTRIPTNVSSHCTEPNWNPLDSSKFAFTDVVSGGFQVCEYDFSSRKTRILTQGTNHSMQPCWASDGRYLYFTRDQFREV